MNYDSPTNQKIKDRFVEQNVTAMVSDIVEYILQNEDTEAPFNLDDIENLYVCEVDGDLMSPEKLQENIDLTYDDLLNAEVEEDEEEALKLQDELDNLEDALKNEETQEILEWWIVSPFLYGKLKEHGEPVINDGIRRYWGRTCSGQAIQLDAVISEICAEIKILDGQEYSWKEQLNL